MVRRIVVIGNGFDLAHNLPTRYSDFLNFIELLPKLKEIHLKHENKRKVCNQKIVDVPPKIECDYDTAEQLYTYISNAIENGSNLDKLFEFLFGTSILQNSFIKVFIAAFKYKQKCNGWIDLESEIESYIDLINMISKREYGSKKLSCSMPWLYHGASKYAEFKNNWLLFETYKDSTTKDTTRLWSELKKELDEVKQFLAVYLYIVTFAKKEEMKNDKLDVISSIFDASYDAEVKINVLNFNYTSTCQKYYNITSKQIQYIHGKISDDIFSTDNDNIVLGMPDSDDKELTTVFFKKYFQRIQYKTGRDYKKWFYKNGEIGNKVFAVFYGHSMDKNDGDLIKYIIQNEETKRTVIYYLDQNDYEKKVINLIEILGKRDFENKYYDGKIIFYKTDEKYVLAE